MQMGHYGAVSESATAGSPRLHKTGTVPTLLPSEPLKASSCTQRVLIRRWRVALNSPITKESIETWSSKLTPSTSSDEDVSGQFF
jgi:hypothetical protein